MGMSLTILMVSPLVASARKFVPGSQESAARGSGLPRNEAWRCRQEWMRAALGPSDACSLEVYLGTPCGPGLHGPDSLSQDAAPAFPPGPPRVVVLLVSSLLRGARPLTCWPARRGATTAPGAAEANGPTGRAGSQAAVLSWEERGHRDHAGSLKRQIAQLQDELQELSGQLRAAQQLAGSSAGGRRAGPRPTCWPSCAHGGQGGGARRAKQATEYAAVPFDSFTLHKVYQLETGLTPAPGEARARGQAGRAGGGHPAGRGGSEQPLRRAALDQRPYTASDFIEGWPRGWEVVGGARPRVLQGRC